VENQADRILQKRKMDTSFIAHSASPTTSPVPVGSALPGSGGQIDYGNENRQDGPPDGDLRPRSNWTADIALDTEAKCAKTMLQPSWSESREGITPRWVPLWFFYNLVQAPVPASPAFRMRSTVAPIFAPEMR